MCDPAGCCTNERRAEFHKGWALYSGEEGIAKQGGSVSGESYWKPDEFAVVAAVASTSGATATIEADRRPDDVRRGGRG